MRRRRAPAVGAVARRARGLRSASASRSRSRDNASSRLRAWDRVSDATTRTTGPKRSSSRARCDGVSDGDPSTSKRTSTRVFDVFACCPPGPPGPEKRHSSSSNGIAHVPVTRSHRTSAHGTRVAMRRVLNPLVRAGPRLTTPRPALECRPSHSTGRSSRPGLLWTGRGGSPDGFGGRDVRDSYRHVARKQWLRVVAVGAGLALIAAACGGGGGGGGGGQGAQTNIPKNNGKPVQGGSLTYGLEAETLGGWCLPDAQLAAGGIQVE